MKKIQQLALMVILTFMFVACEQGLDPVVGGSFTTQSTIGIYDDTDAIFEYDETVHQSVISSSGLSYRIQNDAQSEYLHLEVGSDDWSTGGSLSVTIQSAGISGVTSGSYTMEVLKNSGSYVWLWSSSKSLGLIIPKNL